MQLRFTQMLAALRQALAFVDENSARFPDIVAGGGRPALSAAIDGLSTRAVAQAAHQLGRVGQGASEKSLARALRRNHINPLVKVARLAVPDVAELAAVEIPSFRSNNTELATKAFAMADAVEPFSVPLVNAGLRVHFVAEMRAAAQDLIAAVAGKKGHRRGHVRATEAIDAQVSLCRRVVGALDSLVRAAIPEQDDLVFEWENIVRDFRGALGTPSETAVPPAAPVTAPVAAAA